MNNIKAEIEYFVNNSTWWKYLIQTDLENKNIIKTTPFFDSELFCFNYFRSRRRDNASILDLVSGDMRNGNA